MSAQVEDLTRDVEAEKMLGRLPFRKGSGSEGAECDSGRAPAPRGPESERLQGLVTRNYTSRVIPLTQPPKPKDAALKEAPRHGPAPWIKSTLPHEEREIASEC